MKAKDLFHNETGELKNKVRTVKDLIRYIETKENKDVSNYSIFLGAGASRSSGIATAHELIIQWMEELYERYKAQDDNLLNNILPDENKYDVLKRYFESNHASWFDGNNPYSSLFEKKFDLAPQRRRFVEQEVDKKLPSIGYSYLVSLVENNYFNAIFTTNFDDLLNEAFYQLSSTRPIVCAHDSSVHSISISSKRPKIIKLHGDYLFEDIKSTLRETESLEHNIKDKLIEFCKEYGLIVVGYSGSDRSIMDVFDLLLKNETYLKNGIYWCVREEDEISPTLKNLFWKDRVYPVLIDGFDEFFCQVHQALIPKVKLFNDYTESKQQKIIQQILGNKKNFKNEGILKAIEALEIDNEKQSFSYELTQKLTENEEQQNVSIKITDTKKLLEIDRLLNEDIYSAYSKANSYYLESSSDNIKIVLLRKLIDISLTLGKKDEHDKWIDELINIDPYNFAFHKLKINSITDLERKYDFCLNLNEKFNSSANYLNSLSDIGLDLIDSIKTYQNDSFIDNIESVIDSCLNLFPSLENVAWKNKISIIKTKHNLKLKNRENEAASKLQSEALSIIDKARKINSKSTKFLDLETFYVINFKDKKYITSLLTDLYSLIDVSSKNKKRNIFTLIDRLYNDSDSDISLKDKIGFYKDFIDFEDYHPIQAIINKLKLMYLNDPENPNLSKYLEKIIIERNFFNDLESLLEIVSLVDISLIDKIEPFVESQVNELRQEYYNKFMSRIYLYKRDYDKSLYYIERQYLYEPIDENYYMQKSFCLLKNKKYKEVIALNNEYEKSKYEFTSDVLTVNTAFAEKMLNPNDYNKSKLDKLTSRTNLDTDVSIASSLIDDSKKHQGISRISKIIENNPQFYFKYNEWVFFDEKELNNLREKARVNGQISFLE